MEDLVNESVAAGSNKYTQEELVTVNKMTKEERAVAIANKKGKEEIIEDPEVKFMREEEE